MTVTTMKVNLTTLLDEAAAVRFWDNVRIGGPDDCWPWVGDTGTREPTGHVRIWHQGVKIYAHRLAYLLAGGHIDDGEVVMHSVCDRGDCQNYLHMRAGTSAENTRERDEKNRRTPFLPHGEAHWSAKLSDADAARIRVGKRLGLNAHHLAALYGVSRSTIYCVWGGLTYPAVLPPSNDLDEPTD
jgi:hypothetical protein